MYINKILYENVGPIKKIDIDASFTDAGNPKPMLLVGENGSGKENIESYYYNMACKTGTLWEHADTRASCSHGFSSYILCWLEQIRKQV